SGLAARRSGRASSSRPGLRPGVRLRPRRPRRRPRARSRARQRTGLRSRGRAPGLPAGDPWRRSTAPQCPEARAPAGPPPRVPREWFLPPHLARDAYADAPLPIGSGQTISQPLIVALMTAALAPRRGHRVLEIGTGSGYQTAILAHLGARVYTVERLPDLLV